MVKKVNKSILHQCPNLVSNIYNNLLHGVKLKEGYLKKNTFLFYHYFSSFMESSLNQTV